MDFVDKKEITEEQLRDAGFKRVEAYLLDDDKSANAKRVAKHREKAATEGVKQINVLAPESSHESIKQIAERTRGGENVEDVLRSLAPEMQHVTIVQINLGKRLQSLPSWKRKLAKLLVGDF